MKSSLKSFIVIFWGFILILSGTLPQSLARQPQAQERHHHTKVRKGVKNRSGKIQLAQNGKTNYTIVLPDEPTPVQDTSAKELASYLQKITGAQFPILSEKESGTDPHRIVIGPSSTSAELLAKSDPQHSIKDTDLEYDQVIIQQCGSSIILSGHPQRGMLYAVYTFLENDLGCRWWTTTEETIPENSSPSITVTPVNYAPKLKVREPYYAGIKGGANAHFAVKMKCNGDSNSIPDNFGSHHCSLFLHSFYVLIPPKEYYDTHPEWFPEIDGHRVVGGAWTEENGPFLDSLPKENRYPWDRGETQLCLSNDELVEEMAKNAIKALDENPGTTIISISQNDNNKGGYCHCEKCRAIDEEEGSHSGSLIRFINKVAERIEKAYPNLYVDTLAYEHTRKPPQLTRPRENVIVRLCPIECSYIQSLKDGEQNRSFAEDIEGWGNMAPHLAIWDYATNFTVYLLPFPNFRVLKDNINFFIDHNAFSVFEQGDYHSQAGDFIQLRAWLFAKLLWNPTADTESLMKEFLSGYYAPEIAPLYLEYFSVLADACEKSGIHLGVYRKNTDDWLTLDDLNRATALHNQAREIAEKLAIEDPQQYSDLPKKVARERLSIDLLWGLNGDTFRKQAEEEQKEYLGPSDPLAAAETFFEQFESYNGFKYAEMANKDRYNEFKESILKKYRPQ